MDNSINIFGCFVSITEAYPDVSQAIKDLASEQGDLFRIYIWGNKGLCDTLKKLKHEDYGRDLKLALFQFYVNPIPIQVQSLKAIENYRKKEKSIGIPIIITEENFFSKTDKERYDFLQESILQKLDLLAEVVKKKKLDTNVSLLKSDLLKLFTSH
ncbi:MAG: hypothetical protein LBG96_14875 [Tannerella sp.]|jgi:hypothetical protein|nr:hypothetical protein [Tannerella sp.]